MPSAQSPCPALAPLNIYRLDGVSATPTGLRHALARLGDRTAPRLLDLDIAGCPALRADQYRIRDQVYWNPIATAWSGYDAGYASMNPDALFLLSVDEYVYAISFGNGATLLDPHRIEAGFGLRFAVRVLDPAQINAATRNRLGGHAQVDHTLIAGGNTIAAFGIAPWGSLVRKLGGSVEVPMLPTAGRLSHRAMHLSGADALSIRLGVQPADLVADLRAITKIANGASPVPELEFATHIRALTDADDALIDRLDEQLAERLGRYETDVEFALPYQAMTHFEETHSYAIKIAERRRVEQHLGIEDIVKRTIVLPVADRIPALRTGYIATFADPRAKEPLGGNLSAYKWITAEIAITDASDQYCLIDGTWYRIGAEHLAAVRSQVAEILVRPASCTLPPWPKSITREEDYLVKEAVPRMPGAVLLDQKLLRTRLHPHGIEAGDILTCDAIAVHVKKAERSSVLSHLFYQAVVGLDALLYDAESRAKLAELVARHGGWQLDPAFVPREVNLAIRWKNGQALTVDTLPTFAQIALLHTVYALRGVIVTVSSIDC
jgi:uncharacterized protein (TIGR04141 family)